MRKLKNSSCDKNQNVTKLKLWQGSKTQIVTILKNSNCKKKKKLKNSNCDKTQIQIVATLKTQILATQFLTKLKQYFGKNNLTLRQPMRCTLGSVGNLEMFITQTVQFCHTSTGDRQEIWIFLAWLVGNYQLGKKPLAVRSARQSDSRQFYGYFLQIKCHKDNERG